VPVIETHWEIFTYKHTYFVILTKNRKPSLKLDKALSPNLKGYKIENLSTCITYPLKNEFKILEGVVPLNVFRQFFILNHITSVKFFL